MKTFFTGAFSRFSLQSFLQAYHVPRQSRKKGFPLQSGLVIFLFLIGIQSVNAQELHRKYSAEIKEKVSLQYILDLPKDSSKPFPLMLFLHGAGERGNDLEKVKAHSPFTYRNLMQEEVAILAPQCPDNVYWDTKAVYELLQYIVKNYNVDQDRIYLTGLSMGGWGTWKLADEHPEMFAAIATVCAPMNRPTLSRACMQLSEKPVWIFHGALDDIVPLEDSTTMYKKLKSCNQKVKYTIFPDDNHNSWDSAYSNPGLYEWMFAQKKNSPNNVKNLK